MRSHTNLCGDVMPFSFNGSSRICLWPEMSVEYVCPESFRRQAARQPDNQTGSQTDRQTDNQMSSQTSSQITRQAARQVAK